MPRCKTSLPSPKRLRAGRRNFFVGNGLKPFPTEEMLFGLFLFTLCAMHSALCEILR